MSKCLKQLFKITSVVVFLIFLILTLVVHLSPFFIDANNYKSMACSEFNKATGMVLKLDGIEFSTAPLYQANLLLDDIKVFDKANKEVFEAKKVYVSVPVLPLLTKTLKISDIRVKTPYIYMVKEKDGTLDIEKSIPKMQSSKNKQESIIEVDLSHLNIIAENYNVEYIDKTTPSNLKARIVGKKLEVNNFDPHSKVRIKTDGMVAINNKKNFTYYINAKINLEAFNQNNVKDNNNVKRTVKTRKARKFNILDEIYKNNIKLNLKADVDINDYDDIDGEILFDKVSLKVNQVQLPDSKIYLKASGGKICTDSTIYIRKGAYLSIDGEAKKDFLNLKLKSSLINLADVKSLSSVLMSSFGVSPVELDKTNISGNVIANLNLKSDFKSLQSNGYLKVSNANISYRGVAPDISAFNSDIKLKDNNVSILNTGGFLAGDKFDISGGIDSGANVDITINAPNVRLRPLLEEYKKKSNIAVIRPVTLKGDVALKSKIKGKLNNFKPTAQIFLSDVYLQHEDFALPLLIKRGKMIATDKKVTLDIPCAFSSDSKFDISGTIPYSLKKVNVIAVGELANQDFSKVIGVGSIGKGKVPAFLNVWGSAKNINLNAQLLNTKNNYILVGDIDSNNIINAHLVFDKNRVNFRDVSLKSTTNTSLMADLNSNLRGAKNLAVAEGSIINTDSKARFKKVKITATKPIEVMLPVGKNAYAKAEGEISVKGFVQKPYIEGNISLSDIKIPDMKTTINNVRVAVKDKDVAINIPSIRMGKSTLSAKGKVDIKDLDPVVVTNLLVKTDYFDADEFFVLLGNINPARSNLKQPPPEYSLKKYYVPNVSPIVIKKGKLYADKLIINKILCSDLSTDFDLDRYNLITADKLSTKALDGDVEGSVSYDISTSQINIKVKADDVNVDDFVVKFLGLPQKQIQGKGFANVDIAFKISSSHDVLRSMHGDVEFNVEDGEMGDLGRIDHYLSAANIIANNILSLNLNRVINSVSVKNTGEFKKAYGKLRFIRGGIMRVDHLKTEGPKLSIYIRGDVNNVNSYGSLDVYGRLSQEIVKVLGPLGEFSLETIMQKVPILSELSKHGIGILQTSVPDNIREEIPPLSEPDIPSQEFKAKVKGNVYKASSVRSFRWIKEPEESSNQIKSSKGTEPPQPLKNDVGKLLEDSQQIFSMFQD